MNLDKFRKNAEELKEENKKFLSQLKKKKAKDLDKQFHKAHQDVFKQTDCLDCANCCKTTSPIFKTRDIKRLAKHFRQSEAEFIASYLRQDDDHDFVLKSSPCVFLEGDNTCRIYEHRPDACADFPHTDRRKMHQILDLTYENTLVCPAVLDIVERLKVK